MSRSLSLSGLALSVLCAAGLAYIHPAAPATSASLEFNSDALHGYMHDNYPSSYGSHGMDDAATNLNQSLQLWAVGGATECDIEPLIAAAHTSFDGMTNQFLVKGIFMDPAAVAIYYDIYFDLGVTDFYLSMLNCNMHPGTGGVAGARTGKRQGLGGGSIAVKP